MGERGAVGAQDPSAPGATADPCVEKIRSWFHLQVNREPDGEHVLDCAKNTYSPPRDGARRRGDQQRPVRLAMAISAGRPTPGVPIPGHPALGFNRVNPPRRGNAPSPRYL